MPRLTPFVLALAAAAVVGCSDHSTTGPVMTPDAASHRIVNGTPTGSSYGSVGALMFDYYGDGLSGDDEICTGSLISPTVFLTAAHCVADVSFTPPGSQFYVSFAPDLYSKSARVIKATGYTYDPQYGHDQANLHDLAVIFLPASATRGMAIYRLPPRGELDVLSAKGALASATFINVGYGTSASRTGIPSFGYDGKRNMSESEFMGLQQYWLGLLMNTSATGLGGDCYGDSGGPKFLKTNPGVVYATVTAGDYNCRATTWDYRTDTDDARAFLGQFVALP
jgi:hypothetical protein